MTAKHPPNPGPRPGRKREPLAMAETEGAGVSETKFGTLHAQMVSMNEALVLGALRQHELAATAETSNLQLQREIGERKQAERSLHRVQAQLMDRAGQLEGLVVERTKALTATNARLEASGDSIRMAKEQYRLLLSDSQIMQGKLSQLTRQIITAQEEERKQISRELHDEVVQTLVGISVELAALGKGNSAGVPHLKRKIAYTQRMVEHSVQAVHRFARGLRPAVLDDLGLIPALLAYSKGLAQGKKFKIQITAFGGVEALGGAERTALFRVAQAALSNVSRHAHASQVKLIISEISGAIRMEINDNGKSFAVDKTLFAKNPKRLGLVGMKERIEMVGGSLTIVSIPGIGTTVSAEIPFTTERPGKRPEPSSTPEARGPDSCPLR
jgi:signal transduction histidine kinase